MQRTRDNDDTAITVAALGGGALLAWLLLRGPIGGGGGKPAGDDAPGPSASTPAPPSPPCRVRIRARGIELNDAPADLATTVNACRATGAADLTATGDAIVGVIAQTARALHAAGVRVNTRPDLRRYVDDAITAGA